MRLPRIPARDNRSLEQAAIADRRRRQFSEHTDFILLRAEHLRPHERELIRSIYDSGRTAAAVAKLLRTHPRSVCRRIHRIVRRITSPEFTFVLRHRGAWPDFRRRVATAVVIEGRTLRDAARHLSKSVYVVRKQLDVVRALLAAHVQQHHAAA